MLILTLQSLQYRSALMGAVRNEHRKIVKLLLSYGVHINYMQGSDVSKLVKILELLSRKKATAIERVVEPVGEFNGIYNRVTCHNHVTYSIKRIRKEHEKQKDLGKTEIKICMRDLRVIEENEPN